MFLERNETGAKINRGRQQKEGRRTREKYFLDRAVGFDGTPGGRPQVGWCGPVGKVVAQGPNVSLLPAAYDCMIQGVSPSQGSAPSARGKCCQKGKVSLLLEVGLPVHVRPDTHRKMRLVWPSHTCLFGSCCQVKLLSLSDSRLPHLQVKKQRPARCYHTGGLGLDWQPLTRPYVWERNQAWMLFSAVHSEWPSGQRPPWRPTLPRKVLI